jgi:hypothetical protein
VLAQAEVGLCVKGVEVEGRQGVGSLGLGIDPFGADDLYLD